MTHYDDPVQQYYGHLQRLAYEEDRDFHDFVMFHQQADAHALYMAEFEAMNSTDWDARVDEETARYIHARTAAMFGLEPLPMYFNEPSSIPGEVAATLPDRIVANSTMTAGSWVHETAHYVLHQAADRLGYPEWKAQFLGHGPTFQKIELMIWNQVDPKFAARYQHALREYGTRMSGMDYDPLVVKQAERMMNETGRV